MTDEKKKERLSLPPMTRGTQAFSMFLFFALGAAAAAFVFGNPLGLSFLPGGSGHAGTPAAIVEPQPAKLYQCPMHAEVLEPWPADCPICGMPLVEVTTPEPTGNNGSGHDSHGGPAGVVEIDPVQVQNIGVVSERARIEEIARSRHTLGILDFNADAVTWVNTKFAGWIEKVHVNYVGQTVARGDPLFDIYSPELVTTQEEYLRALDYRASLEDSDRVETRRQAEDLLRSTRDRLLYWDISREQVETLERTREVRRRLTVYSPVDGVVAEVTEQSLEGMFVEPGRDLYKIADLSTLWVHADVYESDLPWIEAGQRAAVSFRNDPGRTIRGSVLFLYPELSRETRTLKICVELPNPDGRLRPGMYADVVIDGPPVRDAIVIPRSAVLRSGERDLVFVDLGDGRFEPRTVELGVSGEGDRVQVRHGLADGEPVVTQAQFMLDSESRVQEAIAKLAARGTAPTTQPGHAH
jgi:Cu(I)/Ag(I) efflux system membrane fusion protein/cobalt-zinc-cadmium efflux system membrane fusion protein